MTSYLCRCHRRCQRVRECTLVHQFEAERSVEGSWIRTQWQVRHQETRAPSSMTSRKEAMLWQATFLSLNEYFDDKLLFESLARNECFSESQYKAMLSLIAYQWYDITHSKNKRVHSTVKPVRNVVSQSLKRQWVWTTINRKIKRGTISILKVAIDVHEMCINKNTCTLLTL